MNLMPASELTLRYMSDVQTKAQQTAVSYITDMHNNFQKMYEINERHQDIIRKLLAGEINASNIAGNEEGYRLMPAIPEDVLEVAAPPLVNGVIA